MNFKPLRTKIVVLRDDTEKQTKSGLYIVESFREPTGTGVVKAVGPEVTLVKVGDRVVFPPYCGVQLPSNEVHEKSNLMSLDEKFIMATMEEVDA